MGMRVARRGRSGPGGEPGSFAEFMRSEFAKAWAASPLLLAPPGRGSRNNSLFQVVATPFGRRQTYRCHYLFATLSQPLEVFIDSTKLTLHGLIQYFVKLSEKEKNRKLVDLLDTLEFNQVVIFVSKPQRAVELNRLLEEVNFPVMCIHGQMKQPER